MVNKQIKIIFGLLCGLVFQSIAHATVFRACNEGNLLPVERGVLKTVVVGANKSSEDIVSQNLLTQVSAEDGGLAFIPSGVDGMKVYQKKSNAGWELIKTEEQGDNSIIYWSEVDRYVPLLRRLHATVGFPVSGLVIILFGAEASLTTPAGEAAYAIFKLGSLASAGSAVVSFVTKFTQDESFRTETWAAAQRAFKRTFRSAADAANPLRHGDLVDLEKCLIKFAETEARDTKAHVFTISRERRGSSQKVNESVQYLKTMSQDILDNISVKEQEQETR